MSAQKQNDYTNLSKKEVLDKLSTSSEGLSQKEAQRRLLKYGENELPKKKRREWFTIFLSQLKSPLIYILVIAGFVSFLLHERTDAYVIFGAVLVNAVVGFFQEWKATEALEKLQEAVVSKVKVRRGGKTVTILLEEVVPGDILILNLGDKIPADAFLTKASSFQVNEAALTGESRPVEKASEESVFMGTTVVSGQAAAVVVKTGAETRYGSIAKLLSTTEEEHTPLQLRLSKFSKMLGILIGLISIFLFLFGLIKGHSFKEMFTTAVAVAVASIPEGLPLALTVILALGMQKMVKRAALVRKLVAAETLGSTSVICVDKTGTLTEGHLKVVRWSNSLEKTAVKNEEQMLKAAALANDLADPIDRALWEKVNASDKDAEKIYDQNPRLAEIPFSSKNRYMAVVVECLEGDKIYAKGAPEKMLAWSKMSFKDKEAWQSLAEDWAEEGMRVLAFASKQVGNIPEDEKKAEDKLRRKLGHNFTFLGLVGFSDPPRPAVKESLSLCQKAGIKVITITGDYKATAEAVLKQLGIDVRPDEVVEGHELENMSDDDLVSRLDHIKLFARTTPEQKFTIVKALQEKGEVVAMTGDGVNDAPALKRADIGVVVGSATEVAKQTADMVLLDSNFETIVAAVKEGRAMFSNIRKVITYLLSDSFTEVVLIGGALLFNVPLPLLPAQILWVNLVEDGPPNFALSFEPAEEGVMKKKPRPKNAPLLNLEMKVLILIIGLFTDVALFVIFYWLYFVRGLPLSEVRSFTFVALGINSLFYIFACRSLDTSVFRLNFFSNRYLLGAVLIGFLLLIPAVYFPPLQKLLSTEPLVAWEWALLVGIGFTQLMLMEGVKELFHSSRQE